MLLFLRKLNIYSFVKLRKIICDYLINNKSVTQSPDFHGFNSFQNVVLIQMRVVFVCGL